MLRERLVRLGMTAALAGGLMISPALAEYRMTSGQTLQVLGSGITGKCYVGRAPSTYTRATGSSRAFITFGELWLNGGYDLAGEAVLAFSTTTTGRILFGQAASLPPGVANMAFQGFSESYNTTSKILTVRFSILAGTCTQTVIATYHGI